MARERIRLAPGIPDLGALGVASAAELFDEAFLPGPRAELLERGARGSRLRYPLPGTSGPDGRRADRPRGAGTGWLVLERWRTASLAELLRARFTAPRSASLAERAWNVACHLRAHGVATPEPVAVGAAGAGLVSRRSFLLLRELDGYESLARWLDLELSSASRRRGAESLGRALGRLAGSGIELPALDPRSIHLSIEPDLADGACQAESGGPPKNRWPSIAFSALAGARLTRAEPAPRLARLLARLDAELRLAPAATPRLRLRAALRAAQGLGLDRSKRRALLVRVLEGRARTG
jgi:hypothetical protein